MKKGFTGIWLIFLALAIGLAIIAFGAGFWLSNQSEQPSVVFDETQEEVEEEEEEIVEVEEVEPTIVESADSINVDWYSEVSEIEPLSIFNDHFALLGSEESAHAFALGQVVGGDYDGAELTMQIVYFPGMGVSYEEYYVLVPADEEEKPVLIDKYMTENATFGFTMNFSSFLERLASRARYVADEDWEHYNAFMSGIEFDTESSIPELEYSETGTDGYGNVYQFLGAGGLTFFETELDLSLFDVYSYIDGKALYAVDGDEGVWSSMKNLFFTVGEDGRMLVYDVEIPFWDYEVSGYRIDLEISGLETFSGTYTKATAGGCGYESITNVATDEEVTNLESIGRYIGYVLYEPVSYSLEIFGDDYETWQNWHEDSSFEEFLALHPFLYYEDQLGRWIKLSNVEVLPQAECGKPVIYLYPEETMQIDVTVAPEGGFSYTEPVYNDGWSVIAEPDGTLTNISDGEQYPYLFWEGKGGLYQSPEHYWVVSQEEVERFLVKTLGKYGLNHQEIADFMEFWYPRMQDAPYYKIGFHGTAAMDLLAPLELSVEPDSIFRILMDFEELEEPVQANPPVIQGFEREEFTVVEWGGVIQ